MPTHKRHIRVRLRFVGSSQLASPAHDRYSPKIQNNPCQQQISGLFYYFTFFHCSKEKPEDEEQQLEEEEDREFHLLSDVDSNSEQVDASSLTFISG